MEKKPVTHILAGLIIGFVSIILFLIFYYTGNPFEKNAWSWMPPLVVIVMVVFFVIQYGKADDGHVTFGSLFNYGFKTTTIFVLLMTVFWVVIIYLFPEYKDKYMEAMMNEMEKQESIPDEQKQTAIEFMDKNFNLVVMGGALFMNVLLGTIGSLIGAALAKKRPSTPFDNQV